MLEQLSLNDITVYNRIMSIILTHAAILDNGKRITNFQYNSLKNLFNDFLYVSDIDNLKLSISDYIDINFKDEHKEILHDTFMTFILPNVKNTYIKKESVDCYA